MKGTEEYHDFLGERKASSGDAQALLPKRMVFELTSDAKDELVNRVVCSHVRAYCCSQQ